MLAVFDIKPAKDKNGNSIIPDGRMKPDGLIRYVRVPQILVVSVFTSEYADSLANSNILSSHARRLGRSYCRSSEAFPRVAIFGIP